MSVSKKRTIQVLSGFIELLFPAFLSMLLFEYGRKFDDYSRHHDYLSQDVLYLFTALFYAILIIEWLRRYKSIKDKYTIYRYLYIIFMVISFILSIKYIDILVQK